MKKLCVLALLAFSVTLAAQPAYADKGHHGRGHGPSHHDKQVVVIDNSDRVVIREYLHNEYAYGCPPGLAKKHNGCQPPGHTKRYRVGYVLPAEIVYVPAPPVIVERLHPAPVGYSYVQVDQDILLMNAASKKIIDAVTLMSAID